MKKIVVVSAKDDLHDLDMLLIGRVQMVSLVGRLQPRYICGSMHMKTGRIDVAKLKAQAEDFGHAFVDVRACARSRSPITVYNSISVTSPNCKTVWSVCDF